MKRIWNIITRKMFVAAVLFLLEIILLIFMVFILGTLSIFFGIILYIFSLLTVLLVNNSSNNPAYKVSWINSIIFIPFAGAILYIIFGKHHTTKNMKARFNRFLDWFLEVVEDCLIYWVFN